MQDRCEDTVNFGTYRKSIKPKKKHDMPKEERKELPANCDSLQRRCIIGKPAFEETEEYFRERVNKNSFLKEKTA